MSELRFWSRTPGWVLNNSGYTFTYNFQTTAIIRHMIFSFQLQPASGLFTIKLNTAKIVDVFNFDPVNVLEDYHNVECHLFLGYLDQIQVDVQNGSAEGYMTFYSFTNGTES
jgi:hypothetical protein